MGGISHTRTTMMLWFEPETSSLQLQIKVRFHWTTPRWPIVMQFKISNLGNILLGNYAYLHRLH